MQVTPIALTGKMMQAKVFVIRSHLDETLVKKIAYAELLLDNLGEVVYTERTEGVTSAPWLQVRELFTSLVSLLPNKGENEKNINSFTLIAVVVTALQQQLYNFHVQQVQSTGWEERKVKEEKKKKKKNQKGKLPSAVLFSCLAWAAQVECSLKTGRMSIYTLTVKCA